MAELNQSIENLIVGDDFDVRRTVTSIPTAAILAKAWLTIKAKKTDLDAAALIQKVITSSPTADGQITDTGADGTGEVLFQMTKIETALLTPDVLYHYDVQLLLDNGKLGTLEVGTIYPHKGLTDAAS